MKLWQEEKQNTEYFWTDSYLYPPGCPMIVPGERISRECIKRLAGYQKLGFKIEGLEKEGSIGVWNNG